MEQPRPESTEEPASMGDGRQTVRAFLVEAEPRLGGLGHWILASPLLIYLGWLWVDLFIYFSPIPWAWVERFVGVAAYLLLVVLPLGNLAFWGVTSLPHLFQHAGWDVQLLEPVPPEKIYLVRYAYQGRERAPLTWHRAWVRAAQGWVYLEIAAVFLGFVAMVLLFFSAVEFGFGRR